MNGITNHQRIDALFARCEGAYSDNTLRGYQNDLKHFQAWCDSRQLDWLPAEPAAIAAFVDEQAQHKAIATIKHRVDAIKFAHRMADLPPPTENSTVYLSLRRARRARPRRPRQSAGLTSVLLEKIVAACPDTLSGLRDAALLSVGYDTLCRSHELAAMQIEHLNEDRTRIRIPISKSDPFGEGRTAYLSGATTKRLGAWLSAASLSKGPLFRGLHTRKLSDRHLATSSIRRLIKFAATRARMDAEVVRSLSGHSMRVGAAQDMMIAGSDMIGIMHAGGWKSHAVLSRYVENASAERMHVRRWAGLREVSAG
ncbi:tyrosine-type recombinase/integrase [Blastomonas sp.]|uniref:tyrosine-type recombinase/integrase n=1 Tax=Blastomonas sp. TaxID=1909299 RepID=UPI0035937448